MDGNAERERVARLRPFSYEEIIAALPEPVAIQVDLHQVADLHDHHVPIDLWPANLETTNPEAVNALTNNTAMYDEEIELALDNDTVLNAYQSLRYRVGESEELAAAIRARRTVLVSRYLISLSRTLSAAS